MTTPNRTDQLRESLERRILHGLSLEWENAIDILKDRHRRLMKKPLFSLGDMERKLGEWSAARDEIRLSRTFVLDHPWDSVCEVLKHEMAHQLAHRLLQGRREPPHGPVFQKACDLLRADPRASGGYPSLREQVFGGAHAEEDRIMRRVQKLLALAESANPHEAEAAMVKAHDLIARHNIDLLDRKRERRYVSIFLGKPALRHTRDAYALSSLLQAYYFVEGIWTPAYVLEKGKMGRVLEISGTPENVEIADYVHGFVRGYIDAQWRTYNKDKGLTQHRKVDFAVGIINGFSAKLKRARERIADESPETRALIHHGDPHLTRYFRHRYPRISAIQKGPIRRDPNVYTDGVEAGEKLVISKGVTQRGEAGGRLPYQQKQKR
jgi:hypothetical protein